jgi:CARDB
MIVTSALVVPVQAAQGDPTLQGSINGPSVVGLGAVTQYTIAIIGGPAGTSNGTYSYQVTMSGFASNNATLIPGSGSSTTGLFKVNLTTPQVLGDLTIRLNATSTSPDGTANSTTTTFDVKVISPVIFTVNIRNTGNMTVSNIPVYFYVDYSDSNQVPIYVANVTIDALSTKVVSYNWTTTSLGTGSHQLKVQIDPNATFISFDRGGTVQTTTFYYNQADYGTTNALLYVALIVLLIVVYLVYRRPAPRKKK